MAPARRLGLQQIRAAVRRLAYDMTAHANEEAAEDGMTIVDVEAAILSGFVVKAETDDPRDDHFTIHGTAVDGQTSVGVVGRFTETGRYLIIPVCEVTD
jgi:hypothetical protein